MPSLRSQQQSIRQTIPFTAEQLLRMAEMYRSGKSLRDISRVFGISRMTVRKRLMDVQVEMREFTRLPMLSDESCIEVLRQRDCGLKIESIANDLSCDTRTIGRAILRAKSLQ